MKKAYPFALDLNRENQRAAVTLLSLAPPIVLSVGELALRECVEAGFKPVFGPGSVKAKQLAKAMAALGCGCGIPSKDAETFGRRWVESLKPFDDWNRVEFDYGFGNPDLPVKDAGLMAAAIALKPFANFERVERHTRAIALIDLSYSVNGWRGYFHYALKFDESERDMIRQYKRVVSMRMFLTSLKLNPN